MAWLGVISLARSLRRCRPLTAARPPPSLCRFSTHPPPEAAPSPPLQAPAPLSRSPRRCRPLTAARPPPSLCRFSAPPPPEAAPSPPLPAPVRSCTTREVSFSPPDDFDGWREVSFSPPDFDHWIIVMKHPGPNTTEDQIKQSFVDTLAQVVGSEDEARAKIYSMSLKYFIGFGARISMELSDKIEELPTVDRVQHDSYVDEEKKVFGILDIACKDEEWDRNSLRDDGDNFAEAQICYIRDLKKYKLTSKTLRMRL